MTAALDAQANISGRFLDDNLRLKLIRPTVSTDSV